MTFIQNYKQNEIRLRDTGEFYIDETFGRTDKPCPQAGLVADTLKALRAAIDKAQRAKFNRIECIVGKWARDFKRGVITSVSGSTARITTADSKGEFVYDYKHNCYPLTPHNVALFDEIDICQIAIRDLEDEIIKLKNKMISFEQEERTEAIRKKKRDLSSPDSPSDA